MRLILHVQFNLRSTNFRVLRVKDIDPRHEFSRVEPHTRVDPSRVEVWLVWRCCCVAEALSLG